MDGLPVESAGQREMGGPRQHSRFYYHIFLDLPHGFCYCKYIAFQRLYVLILSTSSARSAQDQVHNIRRRGTSPFLHCQTTHSASTTVRIT